MMTKATKFNVKTVKKIMTGIHDDYETLKNYVNECLKKVGVKPYE